MGYKWLCLQKNDFKEENEIEVVFQISREKLGMVVHACNPALETLRQEDHHEKASLGYFMSSRPA